MMWYSSASDILLLHPGINRTVGCRLVAVCPIRNSLATLDFNSRCLMVGASLGLRFLSVNRIWCEMCYSLTEMLPKNEIRHGVLFHHFHPLIIWVTQYLPRWYSAPEHQISCKLDNRWQTCGVFLFSVMTPICHLGFRLKWQFNIYAVSDSYFLSVYNNSCNSLVFWQLWTGKSINNKVWHSDHFLWNVFLSKFTTIIEKLVIQFQLQPLHLRQKVSPPESAQKNGVHR